MCACVHAHIYAKSILYKPCTCGKMKPCNSSCLFSRCASKSDTGFLQTRPNQVELLLTMSNLDSLTNQALVYKLGNIPLILHNGTRILIIMHKLLVRKLDTLTYISKWTLVNPFMSLADTVETCHLMTAKDSLTSYLRCKRE